MNAVTYAQAIHEALIEEMRRDKKVFVLEKMWANSESLQDHKGLIDEFGPGRVKIHHSLRMPLLEQQ